MTGQAKAIRIQRNDAREGDKQKRLSKFFVLKMTGVRIDRANQTDS
jgi:hypothetical protein